MSLAQTRQGSLARRLPGGGLPCQPRPATRSAAPPQAGRVWSTFGPHAIGAERFATVSSGTSFAQVVGGILRKRVPVQNPDKDEAAGSSPARPTTPCLTWGNAFGCLSKVAGPRSRLRAAVQERIPARMAGRLANLV